MTIFVYKHLRDFKRVSVYDFDAPLLPQQFLIISPYASLNVSIHLMYILLKPAFHHTTSSFYLSPLSPPPIHYNCGYNFLPHFEQKLTHRWHQHIQATDSVVKSDNTGVNYSIWVQRIAPLFLSITLNHLSTP